MRKTRVATICVQGDAPTDLSFAANRLDLLARVGQVVRSQARKPDAVIFPGGFFFSPENIGEFSVNARRSALNASPVGRAARAFARATGVLLITGIDTAPLNASYGGDQLSAAFDGKGLIALGRKVFPVAEDIDGKRMPPMIIYETDYDAKHRTVQLPSGHRAVLCACYDMFGIATQHLSYTSKLNPIRLMKDADGRWVQGKDLPTARRRAFNLWKDSLRKEGVSIGISTIHRFQKPGREGFWQRHGIASASAAMSAHFACAAAHFKDTLPGTNDATLAALNVPTRHLSEQSFRKAHYYKPDDGIVLPGAVMRVFSF